MHRATKTKYFMKKYILSLVIVCILCLSACGSNHKGVETEANRIVEAIESNDMKTVERLVLGTEDFITDEELEGFFEESENGNNGIIAKIIEQDSIKVKKITDEHIVYEITAPELSDIFEDVMKEENLTGDSFEEFIYNYIATADKTKSEVKVSYTYKDSIFTAEYSTSEFMNGITGNLISAYQELVQQMIQENNEEDVR